jgi:DNA-binding winged helix-turn-helix (wHTH) protein/Tol biopolymer transport system component
MNNSVKYHLTGLTFCPSTKIVEKADGSTEKLVPQRAKILTLFIENKGELVTFDQLHQQVWKNRKVEDKTVQAALTKLRISLGWQADENLINERSEGYRLVCKVETLSENNDAQTDKAENTAPEKINKLAITHSLSIVLLSLLMLSVISFVFSPFTVNSPLESKAFKTTPITYLKGQEVNPSLSPNGKLLAFTHAKNKTLQYQVRVKFLSNNKFLFVDDAPFSSTPTWSADGVTLYYQAFENEECLVKQVHLVDELTFSKPEVITTCGKEKSVSPVAVDKTNEWLYFSHKMARNKSMQIKRINLTTAKEQQLTSPTEDAYGDYSLSLSPDGKTLAILTYDASAIGRLYAMDLQTKEKIMLFSYKHLLYNVAWAQDSQSLFYIDQDAYIVQFDLIAKTQIKITQLSQTSQTIQVIENNNFLVGFGELFISDLYKSALGTYKTVPLQESYFNDHSITPINALPEQYAFVSNRSGLKQIWLYEDGSLKQLTHYQKQRSIKALQLSPDNNSLVYLTDSSVNVIDIKEQTYQQITALNDLFRSPIWHCNNGKILATTKVNDVWSLAEISPNTGDVITLVKGITSIKADCNNDKYYVAQEETFGISLLSNLQSSRQLAPLLADFYFGSGKQWLVENGTVYFVHQRAFYSAALDKESAVQKHMSNVNVTGFKLLDSNMYFAEKVLNDSSIAQISLKNSKKQ